MKIDIEYNGFYEFIGYEGKNIEEIKEKIAKENSLNQKGKELLKVTRIYKE